MKLLAQINGTENDRWQKVRAKSRVSAVALVLKRDVRHGVSPFDLMPCDVYVSLGNMRHENGAPMAVEKFRVERR
jgi:hypothetical protein